MVKSELRIIGLMFFVLLLAACSKDGDSPDMEPVLNVYVYSPEHPMITRGDVGNVAPINDEGTIKTLQIWVFEHGTGNLVSYYSPTSVDNLKSAKGVTYQLNVSDAFAKAKPKPNVDVYVVANVKTGNCGLSYDEIKTKYPYIEEQEQDITYTIHPDEIGRATYGARKKSNEASNVLNEAINNHEKGINK